MRKYLINPGSIIDDMCGIEDPPVIEAIGDIFFASLCLYLVRLLLLINLPYYSFIMGVFYILFGLSFGHNLIRVYESLKRVINYG